jgi:hypothetical protein
MNEIRFGEVELAIGLQAIYQASRELAVRQGQILSRHDFLDAFLTAFIHPLDALGLMQRHRPVGLVTQNAPAAAPDLDGLYRASGWRGRGH